MKLKWILYSYFVTFHQLVYISNGISTLSAASNYTKTTSLSDVITKSTTLNKTSKIPEDINFINNSLTEFSELSANITRISKVSSSVPVETSQTLNKEPISDAIAVSFPGQNILPDPLQAPDVSNEDLVSKNNFYNITVHGLSNFSVDGVNALLDKMTVDIKIHIKYIRIFGNVSQSNVFFTTRSPFNLTLNNVTAEGTVYLVLENDDSLRAKHTLTNMKYEQAMFQFGENTSRPLPLFENTAGPIAVKLVMPFIQACMNKHLTAEVNEQLKSSLKFVAIKNKSPIDLAILKGREYVGKHYDPYVVKNIINFDSDYFTLKIGPVTLVGLSNFARVGNITFEIANRTAVFKLGIITGKVYGEGQFYFDFGKLPQFLGRRGQANFSVDYLQFEAILHQPLNLQKKPYLQDLHLEVGPISVQLDKESNFDYFIELGIDYLPNILRYYLTNILETPTKIMIQKNILDEVDAEEIVSNNLPLFEQMFLDNRL